MKLTGSEIPILFCQAIQNGEVLEHPDLTQTRPVPETERDPDLELVVPVGSVTDPEVQIDSAHILAPLFKKASLNEELVTVICHQHQISLSTIFFSALPRKLHQRCLGLKQFKWTKMPLKLTWTSLILCHFE